ncbi:flagellar biosynthetic protein FliR [Fodinicurvata sp. EGI_FJ10296]|uniref:flagellar biosynthetic protein FliR n=1 Tax=Fodinicurvata sp. EGI_FJ10296 TaxID=3231908 RepID=UPI00345388D6
MELTESALYSTLFPFAAVFLRVGAALMVLPGIGDGFVNPRIRLIIALGLTLVVAPVVEGALPPAPQTGGALGILIIWETLYGLFIGLVARFIIAAVDIAGMIISFAMSFANAFVFNPAMEAQGSLVSNFLGLIAIVIIYLGDFHHLMLIAIVDSYSLFEAGTPPPIGDMADMLSRLLADSFSLGLRMAAPFVTLSLVFYLGLGLLARLMPQVQIFFVALPMNILLGLIVMAMVLSSAMLFWLEAFQDRFTGLLAPV